MSGTLYEVTISTGTKSGAGTNANVYITLYGSQGTSPRMHLKTPKKGFENGAVDKFHMTLRSDVGDIGKIK